MDAFWKGLCEIKIMPLTTDYFPDMSNRAINEKYIQDIYNLDIGTSDTIAENLGLRLSQNFQLVSPFGTCDFTQFATHDREYFKMSLRNRYAVCQPLDKDRCQILAYVKKKEVQKLVYAEFIYLLFNPNLQQFVKKEARESRLISRTSLNNIDLVQNDFKESVQNCIRLPQSDCVIFCDIKALRRKLGHAEKLPANLSQVEMEDLLRGRTAHEEKFEMETFCKIRDMIMKMITRDGLSKKNKVQNLSSVKQI
jgi:hypothetical protein